ncbi:MAG: uroporphyrinogen-III C-methyltransferase [Acidobacteriota bacterium]
MAFVDLVGAGPGDPELLTVRAWRAIREADVVVHDRLVSQQILDLIPAGTERIDVGKARGTVRRPQEAIQRLLVELARRGRRVVRLKGGDPFVFGRGTEELDTCLAAGIECRVVPGISSALAAPASAGVPVTERGIARSFAVVTAETRTQAGLDQLRGAVGVDTLVLMMTATRLRDVVRELIRLGRPASQPAAAIENATRAEQRVVATSLDHLANEVEHHGLGAPMTVVVGEVAARARAVALPEWVDALVA